MFHLHRLVYLLALLVLLADVYGYGDSVEKYLKVDSFVLGVVLGLALVGMRIFNSCSYKLGLLEKINNFVVLPLFFILSVAYSLVEFVLPPNVAFSVFHLNSHRMFGALLLCGLAYLLSLPRGFFERKKDMIIFLSGVLTFLSFVLIRLWPYEIFHRLSQEGNLVENLQIIALLAGAVSSFILFKKYLKKHFTYTLIYFMLMIGFLGIAGEEISWGQRLLNIVTPDYFSERNVQKEINIHNLSTIGTTVPYIYSLVGFLGSFMWEARRKVQFLQKEFFDHLIPGWQFMFYFYFSFIFNLPIILGNSFLGEWSEFAELMLYIGTSLFVVDKLFKTSKLSRTVIIKE